MDEIGRFEACYAQYGAMLFRLALNQMGTKEAPEDAAEVQMKGFTLVPAES